LSKNILILFLISTHLTLFAQDNSHLDMKAKANSDGKVVSAKLQLQSPMINFEVAKRHNAEANFISHLTAVVENQIVLDIDISKSSFLLPKPVIKYKFKDINQANAIRYIVTNNKGETKEHVFEIKRENKLQEDKKQFKDPKTSVINLKETNPLVWEAKNSKEAIKELYGSIEDPITDKINLIMPKSIDCDWAIPVNISSDVDLESLALFIDIDTTEASTLAIFSISPFSIVDYKLLIHMRGKEYTLTAIGKDRNGNFYKVTNKGSLPITSDACL